jgi:thymidine phosphorylase
MQTQEKARELAQTLVALGNEGGVNTRALLTNMQTPLGRAAGNWLEVRESVLCLEGRGPADLRELVLACASHLLVQTGKAKTLGAARRQAEDCLASASPRKKWDEMLAAQGADLAACNRKLALDHTAPVVVELKAPASGYVSRCDARMLGEAVRDLGGGRFTKEADINYDVGVDALVKPGEAIKAGGLLARIHAADRAQADAACARLKNAFGISAQPPVAAPLIAEIIAQHG